MVRFVILAGGKARRMGQDKLSMLWQNGTVLSHVVQTVLDGISLVHVPCQLTVIAQKETGAYLSEPLAAEFFSRKGTWIVRKHSPLAENIKRGLLDWEKLTGVAFLPGDQVGIRSQEIAALLTGFSNQQPDFLVPCHDDLPGSPVFFHPKYFPELFELEGENGGKAVLHRYEELWLTLNLPACFFSDIDTMEDYLRLRGKESDGY